MFQIILYGSFSTTVHIQLILPSIQQPPWTSFPCWQELLWQNSLPPATKSSNPPCYNLHCPGDLPCLQPPDRHTLPAAALHRPGVVPYLQQFSRHTLRAAFLHYLDADSCLHPPALITSTSSLPYLFTFQELFLVQPSGHRTFHAAVHHSPNTDPDETGARGRPTTRLQRTKKRPITIRFLEEERKEERSGTRETQRQETWHYIASYRRPPAPLPGQLCPIREVFKNYCITCSDFICFQEHVQREKQLIDEPLEIFCCLFFKRHINMFYKRLSTYHLQILNKIRSNH